MVLEQKKPFSACVFDDIAEKLLLENPTLRDLLNQKIKADKDFVYNKFSLL